MYKFWTALKVPGCWSFQISRQSVHEGGKICQPYAPAAFNLQKIFLVLISVAAGAYG
jgi:hypothetical protein